MTTLILVSWSICSYHNNENWPEFTADVGKFDASTSILKKADGRAIEFMHDNGEIEAEVWRVDNEIDPAGEFEQLCASREFLYNCLTVLRRTFLQAAFVPLPDS